MTAAGRLEGIFTVPTAITASVTNNGGGPTAVTFAAGTYTPTSFATYMQTALTAQRAPSGGAWTVSLSTGSSGTGLVTIAMSSGTYSITWSSTALRDLLGFTATITTQTSVTGTINHRGLWLPGCPFNCDGDPDRAPEATDTRSSKGPTGTVMTLSGTQRYEHTGLKWSHVLRARTWEGAASPAYSSFQAWVRDTQFGSGHAWFVPGSAFQIYWDNNGTDRIVGYDLNSGSGPTYGWKCSPAIARLDAHAKVVVPGWVGGLYAIEIPGVTSEG